MGAPISDYPVNLAVDYPDRSLNRLTTGFRIFVIIPIAVVLGSVGGGLYGGGWDDDGWGNGGAGAGGLLFFGPLLMLLFRHKYPRWWFDWNRALLRFVTRVAAYLFLLRDEYPSTDDDQAVHLTFEYPDAPRDLNRWLPLVKWFLAIPHYVVLFFLNIGVFIVWVIAYVVILFTGRYPRGLFDYVVGVIRWHNRVLCYAFLLTTDRYPPFRLAP